MAEGNRGIGFKNKLLFWIPDDLKRFKALTISHVIIMGQKTFESIGKPLPDRTNIVITSNQNFQAEGCLITHSIEKALEKGRSLEKEEMFFIGGGSIYKQSIDLADKLYLTLVDGSPEADTFFPDYSVFRKVVFKKPGQYQNLKYKFVELEK